MNLSEEEYSEHVDSDDGYCTQCDDFTRFGLTEPDAENYPCDECETNSVMGAEQALICGHLTFEDDE